MDNFPVTYAEKALSMYEFEKKIVQDGEEVHRVHAWRQSGRSGSGILQCKAGDTEKNGYA